MSCDCKPMDRTFSPRIRDHSIPGALPQAGMESRLWRLERAAPKGEAVAQIVLRFRPAFSDGKAELWLGLFFG
jgi:hypothetical protein